jgi:hypothetical protein
MDMERERGAFKDDFKGQPSFASWIALNGNFVGFML